MVSYDVCSLFTNIPLYETINLAVELIFKNNPEIKIKKVELKKLFLFATAQTHFMFNDKIYDQIDGVAMGSPLAPILANLFMGHHESNWLDSNEGSKVLFYRRYVDDIFCLFDSEQDSDMFLCYLNEQHPNIKFTNEKENNNKLPFLDILLSKDEVGINMSVYKKVLILVY